MIYPPSPAGIRCMLRKMTERGLFAVTDVDLNIHYPMPPEAVYEAIEEFVRDIEAGYDGVSVPKGARRLSGLLFIRAIEAAVTSGFFQPGIVTVSECQG